MKKFLREKVIKDFALSYEKGETPIPCVLCNEKNQFEDLFNVAKELNADALVTGHYIKSVEVKMEEKCIGRRISRETKAIFFLKLQKNN